MSTFVRTTLLAVSSALGVAVALGLALQKPRTSDAPSIKSVAVATDVPPRDPPAVIRDPVVAPYHGLVAGSRDLPHSVVQERLGALAENALAGSIALLQQQLQTRAQAGEDAVPPPPAPGPAAPDLLPPAAPPLPPEESQPSSPPQSESLPNESLPPSRERVHRDEGDDRLSINVQNSDIRQVLEQLNRHGGLNIMASRSVQGAVSANLTDVTVETALAAILKTTGFVARREGNILYVGTPADLAMMDQTQDRIGTRVYRPNYIRAADLQGLIAPLLSPGSGTVTLSSPAEVDIPADQTKTGGDSYAGTDVVIVRDYESILCEIDQLFAEVDVKPRQIAIEAMILSVDLKDEFKLGVNFEALRDRNNVRIVSGQPLTSLANIALDSGGLKFGFLDASLGVFIDALETIGDTNVIASPRLTCLNKQRAEIQIGQELGYVSTTITETAATQTVNFLEVGTLLRIRPFIGNDGMIRLEVHPELSTGTVEVKEGMSLPQKSVTQVTTNVLCADGRTVVIGGLIREDLTNTTSQIPYLGSLPWVGPLFRQKTEKVNRNEIIVLITPRIVSEPFLGDEGQQYGNEFTQRQSVYFDKMSPIARRNLGLYHLRKARAAFAAADYATALMQVNRSIHYDPLHRDAITLRNEIIAAGGFEDESIHEYLHQGLSPFAGGRSDYSKYGYPWKEFEGFGPPHISSVDDPGVPGTTRPIVRPPASPPHFVPPHAAPPPHAGTQHAGPPHAVAPHAPPLGPLPAPPPVMHHLEAPHP